MIAKIQGTYIIKMNNKIEGMYSKQIKLLTFYLYNFN